MLCWYWWLERVLGVFQAFGVCEWLGHTDNDNGVGLVPERSSPECTERFGFGSAQRLYAIIWALKQNITYMADLKDRKRKPHEQLPNLGFDIVCLVRRAYPQAPMHSMPGSAVETRLHVMRGETRNITTSYSECHYSVLESTETKCPRKNKSIRVKGIRGSS